MAAPRFEFHPDIVELSPAGIYRSGGKRAFDLLVLLVLAPVALPLLLGILAIVAMSGGNPLHSQLRVGRNGHVFQCWKVRTMIPDADAALPRILLENPALLEEWRLTQKLMRDPRVTLIGRFLRRLSLDELPQLWNVLNGTMSLVGPRPFMPQQASIYRDGGHHAGYFQLRPGITGLWQVSRRNEGAFSERVMFDREYSENFSFLGDIVILLRTAGAVLRATGV